MGTLVAYGIECTPTVTLEPGAALCMAPATLLMNRSTLVYGT